MADKIAILVQLNDTEAKQKIKALKDDLAKLENGVTIPVRAEAIRTINKDISDVESKIKSLSRGYNIEVRESGLIVARDNALKTSENMQKVGESARSASEELSRTGEAARAAAEEASRPYDPDTSGLDSASRKLSDIKESAVSISDVLSTIGSGFSTIGGALESIGGIFNFDLLGTITKTITGYFTVGGLRNMGGAVKRYDILNTYADYMGALGVSPEVAESSKNRIDQAIRGIPVGLETAAQEIRMYTMYLRGKRDTMDETAQYATEVATGLERALAAGGAPTAAQTTTKYEVERLMSVGSLNMSRQWQALLRGLGVTGGILQIQMGYGDIPQQEFIERLSKTKGDDRISTDEFLEGLAGLATNEDLNDLIEIYKGTLEAMGYNLQNAKNRFGQRLIEAVNDVLYEETGKEIAEYATDFRDAIDETSYKIVDWVKENPEVITSILDKFYEVLEKGKELNVGQLVKDIVDAGLDLVDFFSKLIGIFPEGWIRKFMTFSMVWATPLGRLFSRIGSVFTFMGQMSGILGKLPLIGRFLSLFKLFAPKGVTVNGVGGLKTLAAGVGTIAAMGVIIGEYAQVFKIISDIEFGPNLEKNMVLVGSTVLAVGALTGGMSAVMGSLTDLQQLSMLKGGGLTLGFEVLVALAGGVIFEFAKIGETIGAMDLGNYENNLDAIEPLIRKVIIALGIIVGGVGAGSYFTGGAVALFAAIGEAVAMGLLAEMDYASQIIVKFANVAQTISDMELVPDFDTKVTDLADGISAIYNAMPSLTDAEVTGSGNYYVFYKNMGDAFTSMGDAAVALKRAKPSFESLNRTLGEFDGIKKDVSEFAQGIGEIYSVLEANFHLGYEAKWGSNNYPTIIKNMGDAVDKMKEVADKIKSMELELKFLNLGLSGTVEETITSETNIAGPTSGVKTTTYGANDRFQGLVNRLKELMTGVKDIIGVFGEDWIMSLFSEWRTSAQYKTITNIKDAIGSVSDIATNIQEAADKLEAINYRSSNGPSVLEYFKDNFAPLINGVREAIGAADTTTFESKIAEIGVMVSSVNSLLTTMGEVDISNLLTDMSSLVEVMNNDLNPAMDQLGQFTGTAKTNAMQLSHNIRGIGTDAENNAGKIGGLASQIDSLATQLGSAAINANSLRNALNNMPTKISVDTDFHQIRANPLSMWPGFSNGGPVGTDTIPAWLSEGEFVMRSKAVQTFGQQFMAQVNALNIPGALNALVRHYTLPQSAQVSNISNRDNHAVVNQYISTNNPNYTYARASKYVRAL